MFCFIKKIATYSKYCICVSSSCHLCANC